MGTTIWNRIFAKRIRTYNDSLQRVEVIQKLLADEMIGKIYVSEKMFDMTISKNDVIEMIKEEYPGYTDVICKRRAQTVLSWLNWMKDQIG